MRPLRLLLVVLGVVLVLGLAQPTAALDGDTSTASISLFQETLSDDVLHAPDTFYRDTIETADADVMISGDAKDGTYVYTRVYGGAIYDVWDNDPVTATAAFNLTVNLPTGSFAVDGISVAANVLCQGTTPATTNIVGLWDYDALVYVDFGDMLTGDDLGWVNFTTYDPSYFAGNIVFYQMASVSGTTVSMTVYCDYLELIFYICTLADSGQAESFSDTSDWSVASATISTNGDVGSVTASATNGNAYMSGLSIANPDYIEARAYYVTGGWSIELYNGTWTSNTITYSTETSMTTKRTNIASLGTITQVRIRSLGATTRSLIIDYLRLSDDTELGWQHNGETTQGTSNDAESGFSYSTSSDGDVLSCNITRTSGSGATFVEMRALFDTTTTVADLERDYYPFWAAQVKVTRSSAASTVVYANLFADGYNSLVTSSISALADWTTLRANHKAATTVDSNKFWCIGGYLSAVGDWIRLQVDYVKAYSIANFTTTFTGAAVGDVAYVSSNALVVDKASATLFQFDSDPTISIASATYGVWNITTNTKTAVGISLYVSDWTTTDDETRGAMPSGTTTDVRIRADADCTISAVKFITDATKPDIVRANAAPTDADDSETMTLSAVASDTLEVYQVYFNAITYPVGFSDVNYYATEQSSNLWTYSFTTMTAGYYCFAVYASDGANVNDLDYYSYLDFTVREADIAVTTITLFGAGNDFTFVTWTFDINRACTYTIREWSGTYAAADTWTGSVAEGVRNIAWQKLSVTDDSVNFTVTFVNGSLSYVFSSSYATPKSTFYFDPQPVTGEGHKFNAEIVWCSGTLSKAATYTIYCDNAQVETGTVSMAVYVDTDKGLPKGQDHLYAFRFVNGSQTLWVNCTYYSYMWNIDEPERGGTGVTTEEYWLRTLTVLTFIAVIIIGAGLGRMGNLPNYRGR